MLAIFSTCTVMEAHRRYHGGHYHRRGWGYRRGYWGRPYGGWGWAAPTVGFALGAAAASAANDDYQERSSYEDDEGRRYWTVKNETDGAILVKTPGYGYKRISPGKSRKISRGRSFKLKVKNTDGDSTSFTSEDHYITIKPGDF